MFQPKMRGSWMQKNKTHLYADYNKLIPDIKTQKNWNWGDGETYPMQWKWKQSWDNNTIRWNRPKTKTVAREKRHYIMIKGYTQQEDIPIVNVPVPNIGTPRYIK